MLTEEPKISSHQKNRILKKKKDTKNDVLSENEMRTGKTKLGRRRGQRCGNL